jgi:probable HAF family extracellular repeat protein
VNLSTARKGLIIIVLAFITSWVRDAVCFAQYSFTPLGFISGHVFAPGDFQTNTLGISDDGSAVVGFLDTNDPIEYPFLWTVNGGMKALAGLEHSNGNARDVSVGGAVVVGHVFSGGYRAFRWTPDGGPVILGDGTAAAVSADGSIVVGRADLGPGLQAFRWAQNEGMVPLGGLGGPLPPGGSIISEALQVSADGSFIVGFGYSASGQEAFRWTQGGGMVGLGDLPGGAFFSQAGNVSADGSVVIGWAESDAGREAFRWTGSDGMRGLGDLKGGGYSSLATGISADGSVIVGRATGPSSNEAFVWTASTGMVSLQESLVAGGADGLEGWRLLSARGVSADGRMIAGLGINPKGIREPWIATIPPIPEPSTWALAACGLLCAAQLRQKRRKALRLLPSRI